jgi:alcohol dehydrogenase
MVVAPFSVTRLPRIVFGEGSVQQVPTLAASFGRRALLVTGRRSLREAPAWSLLVAGLATHGVAWESLQVAGEPSPELVDGAVTRFRGAGIEVVVGIGGGSALDVGKAVAGLLPRGRSVLDYLEGVGAELPYEGPSLPFVAVPTTAGTGSEATRNAVLSRPGPDGFKRSFRDEQLVARVALVDPDLMASCPRALVAADGMDAVTQLLESFVSSRANPFTDALALSGLEAAREGLWAWLEGGARAAEGRRKMAYAALLSGITLAQAGLGAVHGLAAPLGARFPIPHGVACGTLLAEVTAANVAALERREPAHPALEKFERLGVVLAADPGAAPPRRALVETLRDWTRRLELPRLGAFGVTAADTSAVVAGSRGSSMRSNPVVLGDDELAAVLRSRM